MICAVAGRMRSMPKLSKNTKPSGAKITTHFSGPTNKALPNAVSISPSRIFKAAIDGSVVTESM